MGCKESNQTNKTPLVCLCSRVAYIENNMDSDQTAPMGAHIVCFHEKILSELLLNIHNRHKKQTAFSGQK